MAHAAYGENRCRLPADRLPAPGRLLHRSYPPDSAAAANGNLRFPDSLHDFEKSCVKHSIPLWRRMQAVSHSKREISDVFCAPASDHGNSFSNANRYPRACAASMKSDRMETWFPIPHAADTPRLVELRNDLLQCGGRVGLLRRDPVTIGKAPEYGSVSDIRQNFERAFGIGALRGAGKERSVAGQRQISVLQTVHISHHRIDAFRGDQFCLIRMAPGVTADKMPLCAHPQHQFRSIRPGV